MFLFVGIPLEATGFAIGAALGAMFILIGLVAMFAAFVQNSHNEKEKRQARRVAQQVAKLYPQGFYPPQPIIIQAPATSTHSEVTREIVKVRCKSCNSLNFETANRCINCGASL